MKKYIVCNWFNFLLLCYNVFIIVIYKFYKFKLSLGFKVNSFSILILRKKKCKCSEVGSRKIIVYNWYFLENYFI